MEEYEDKSKVFMGVLRLRIMNLLQKSWQQSLRGGMTIEIKLILIAVFVA